MGFLSWLLGRSAPPVEREPAPAEQVDNLLAEIEREETAAASGAVAAEQPTVDAKPLPLPAWEIGIERKGATLWHVCAVYVRCPFCHQTHVHGWPISTPPTLSIVRWANCDMKDRYRVVGFHDPQRGFDGGPAASGPIASAA